MIDFIVAVVSFGAILIAFTRRELTEFGRRWRASHPPRGNSRIPTYLDIDAVLTDIEDAEATGPWQMIADKLKKMIRYDAVILMLGAILMTVVPAGLIRVVIIGILAGLAGAAAGAVAVTIYEIGWKETGEY